MKPTTPAKLKPKWLRAEAADFRHNDHNYIAELLEQCADEIERLRDEVGELRRKVGHAE